jgi:tryptophanyl-tRNA synthetase
MAPRAEIELVPQWHEFGGSDPGRPSIAAFYDPVLMAADILVYGGTDVIVRRDQQRHVELAAEWAERFNDRYGSIFTIPRAVTYGSAWILGDLLAPSRKMSHKVDGAGTLYLEDSNDVLRHKILGSLADREGRVYLSREKPGISNLIRLLSELSGASYEKTEEDSTSLSYTGFKNRVADVVISVIEPLRDSFNSLMEDSDQLHHAVSQSTTEVLPIAASILREVRDALGVG